MNYTSTTPARFARYAKTNLAVWKSVIGQQVTHSKLGDGEIVDAHQHPQGDGLRLEIIFAKIQERLLL